MPVLNLYGFRRSGNHFLAESITRNFKVSGFKKHHINYKNYKPKEDLEILIVRDGRDVMVAIWHWAQANRYGKHLRGKDFSKYIRGQYKNWKDKPLTPLEDWIIDNDSWFDKIYTVKFEDLKSRPIKELKGIGRHFNLVRRRKKLTPVTRLVGHAPRKGVVGDYKSYFKNDDEEYFWQKAGEVMERYGYKR